MSAPVVRAKFQCLSITNHHQHDPSAVQAEVRLIPVYGNGEANKQWSKWTPSGELKMLITNPSAVDQFELGKEYFVDFTPAF
ncbi:hypothetical protein [Mycoplana ramosa]|uniref:Uncharacterized protein n=1 Tax=Mycoplana ramosa TaxID=40837 RepID=A0ABW3YWI2_MYCRA